MAGTSFEQRRGTASQWQLANPILKAGEIGWETDTGVVKMGDGVNTWNNRPPILGSTYLPILGKAADSDKLDGLDSTAFLQTSQAASTYLRITDAAATYRTVAAADAAYLAKTGKAADADKLDGLDSTAFLQTTTAASTYQTISNASVYGRDRGAGNALPSTDLRRGDTFFLTPATATIGNLWVCEGSAWRAVGNIVRVASATERDLYNSIAYDGFQARTMDNDIDWVWTGAASTTNNLWRASGIGGMIWVNGSTVVQGSAAVGPKIFVAKYDAPFNGASYAITGVSYPSGYFTEVPVVQATFAEENGFAVYGGTDQHTVNSCIVVMRATANIAGIRPGMIHVTAIGR